MRKLGAHLSLGLVQNNADPLAVGVELGDSIEAHFPTQIPLLWKMGGLRIWDFEQFGIAQFET